MEGKKEHIFVMQFKLITAILSSVIFTQNLNFAAFNSFCLYLFKIVYYNP